MIDEKALPCEMKPYADGYMVAPDGRVWSERSARFLKGSLSHKGYIRMCLWINGEKRYLRLNRIVAEAFHGPPPCVDSVARHLDDKRLNNHYTNIAWGSVSDNQKDAVRNGLSPAARNGRLSAAKVAGSKCGLAKLTWENVDDIRARRLAGESCVSIGKFYGVHRTTINLIHIGKIWQEKYRPTLAAARPQIEGP